MVFMRPEFPESIGESVEFTKDGNRHRLLCFQDGAWVIHRAEVAAEDFQILITNRREGRVDAAGTGRVSFTALGATESDLFTKLF